MKEWKQFFEVFKNVTFTLWQGQPAAELSYQAFKARLMEETNLRPAAGAGSEVPHEDLMGRKR